jgi:hypothetical protein
MYIQIPRDLESKHKKLNQACYKLVILFFRKRKEKFLFSFPKEQFWCLLFLSYSALYYFSSNIVTTIANNSLLAWYVN